mmetsp:Transcript_29169/g.66907  ORF Transcript_29169/g.66907 Transcript_29169/m.66907 type:complete len:369 (+) Transcript_29169:1448-2554(+)
MFIVSGGGDAPPGDLQCFLPLLQPQFHFHPAGPYDGQVVASPKFVLFFGTNFLINLPRLLRLPRFLVGAGQFGPERGGPSVGGLPGVHGAGGLRQRPGAPGRSPSLHRVDAFEKERGAGVPLADVVGILSQAHVGEKEGPSFHETFGAGQRQFRRFWTGGGGGGKGAADHLGQGREDEGCWGWGIVGERIPIVGSVVLCLHGGDDHAFFEARVGIVDQSEISYGFGGLQGLLVDSPGRFELSRPYVKRGEATPQRSGGFSEATVFFFFSSVLPLSSSNGRADHFFERNVGASTLVRMFHGHVAQPLPHLVAGAAQGTHELPAGSRGVVVQHRRQELAGLPRPVSRSGAEGRHPLPVGGIEGAEAASHP